MTINRFFLPIAAAALSVMTPIAAQAAQFLITYSGTTSGRDFTGVFGDANSFINEAAFKAVYTLTLPTPGAVEQTDGSTFYRLFGGTLHGTSSPIFAELTINGITRTVSGQYNGTIYTAMQPGNHFLGHAANENTGTDGSDFIISNFIYHNIESSVNAFVTSLDPTKPYSYAIKLEDRQRSLWQFAKFDGTGNRFIERANGTMTSESVTVEAVTVGAIPEPATWLMMIVGFGMVGASIRSKRRQSSGAVAAA